MLIVVSGDQEKMFQQGRTRHELQQVPGRWDRVLAAGN